MQVFHTAGVPPRSGRIIWAIMGWMRKSRNALTNSVAANSSGNGDTSQQARSSDGGAFRQIL